MTRRRHPTLRSPLTPVRSATRFGRGALLVCAAVLCAPGPATPQDAGAVLALTGSGPSTTPTSIPVPVPTQTSTPAQTPPPPGDAPDSLRAFLVTFGPGEAVWERFGHNALWIHDPEARVDSAYHYGLFDMSEEGFLLEFVRGRMWYSMGAAPAEWLIRTYRGIGRDATVQELALTVEEVRELREFFRWNMRPGNRGYRYDYFRDNCSTRLRDAIDRVTGGTLREQLGARPAPFTYREQGPALLDDPFLTTGADFALGPLADQPLSMWELTFIPMWLRDELRDVSLDRENGTVPLVTSERSLPAFGRSGPVTPGAAYDRPPSNRVPYLLVLGLVIGGLFVGSAILARRPTSAHRPTTDQRLRRLGRWGLGVGGGLWGLIAGFFGFFQLAIWTLTDHEFGWRNENLLQADPLAIGLAVLVPLAILGDRAGSAARRLAWLVAALSVLGLVLHPLPLTIQQNLTIIALCLPINVGLAWAVHRVTEGTREP